MQTGFSVPKCFPMLVLALLSTLFVWKSGILDLLRLFMSISGGLSWDDAMRPLRQAVNVAWVYVAFGVQWFGCLKLEV